MEYSDEVLDWIDENADRLDAEGVDGVLEALLNTNGCCPAIDQITAFFTEEVPELDTPKVISADLLPEEKVDKLPKPFTHYSLRKNRWWVKGCKDTAMYPPKCVNGFHHMVVPESSRNFCLDVRPALKVANTAGQLFFLFKDHAFRMIDDDTAICVNDIGECDYNKYRTGDTSYEQSEVKKYIDKWFNS